MNVVITDRRIVSSPAPGASTWEAVVIPTSDYYPYGTQMEGCYFTGSQGYRRGYNSVEKDDEIKGNGNSYDFGARMYDNRVGRFLSLDPVDHNFATLTPYQFAGNSPIQAIELDGFEGVQVVDHLAQTTTITIFYLYVPNTNEGETSGFSVETAENFEVMANEYLTKTTFKDINNLKENGEGCDIKFNIQFVPVTTMEEANKIKNDNPDRTAILKTQKLEVVNANGGFTLQEGGAEPGLLKLKSNSNWHTVVHEISHNLAHFSNGLQTSATLGYVSQFGQKDFHSSEEYGGGIFLYDANLDLDQKNVNDMLENLPKVESSELKTN